MKFVVDDYTQRIRMDRAVICSSIRYLGVRVYMYVWWSKKGDNNNEIKWKLEEEKKNNKNKKN